MEYIYKKVDKIVFGIYSPKDVKKMACAKIVTPEIYDKEGYPVDGGLMDVRLGVIDPGLRCKTCGQKLKECIGHFGYIDLARPIVHVKYVKPIYDILRSICRECSKVLMPEEEIKRNFAILENLEKSRGMEARRKKTSEIIRNLRNTKKCPHCNAKQFKISIEKPTTFTENDKKISPIEVRARFEKISDEEVTLLGFNPKYARPEWLILTVLSIPPVTIRPSITLESGERSEDDLTHKLGDIVRINQRLFENINAGAPEVIIEDLWDLLQYHVTTYFDNTLTQIPPARHRSGQPLKTLTERIKSKEGRFRYNLAGKRVNFSARTVISPDSKLDFNEVGVPKVIAMDLTIPERVTEWNADRLKEFVKKGPNAYPGSNYVIRPDGRKKKITDETREQLLEELQPGYVVERHLMDGDIAMFNRQPSLHRMSIMCHKIKVISGRSFKLNPSICVAPETLVQLSSGTQREIDQLKNCWKESELATYDHKKNKVTKTELKKFWGLKPEEYGAKCYKITTESGRGIIATGDHPFYVKNSIKRASKLRNGDLTIVRPLDTPLYEETDKVIVKEKDIRRNSPKETYVKHTLKTLNELKFIPLNLKDQRSMIMARLLGHLFGDGTFILKKDVGRMIFRGSRKDLEEIQKDIESLGFKPEKIYVKTSNGKIETIKGKILNVKGTGNSFEVRHKPLCILFASLGAPNGDKPKMKYRIPKWIMKSPKYIQREFLAAYFGSEMTKPRIRKKTKSNFDNLVFKISKIEENLDSGRKIIDDISKILRKFNIKCKIRSIEDGVKRKDGYFTKVFNASVIDEKSKINLLGKIGFIYDYKKDNLARLAYHYMLLKSMEISKRNQKYKEVKLLRKKGYKFKEISKKLNISISMLENWMYRSNEAALPNSFIGFEEWHKKNADIDKGFVYDKVNNVKETYVPFVYDVTTTLDSHNFFANGFLTKNCFPYNADFDGDEMNLHIPQTEESRAEAEILTQVQTQITSPKHGLNVIGCVEDSISGNYLLTKNMEFNKEDAVQMLVSVGVYNKAAFNKFKSKVNGKEVFSALLPDDFNFIGQSKNKEEVIVKNGILLEGVIDDNAVGVESGALLREYNKMYGDDPTLEFMGKVFRLGIAALLHRGFTTGISDLDLDEELVKKINAILNTSRKETEDFIEQFKKGDIEIIPSKTIEESLEIHILQVLNNVRNKVGRLILESVTGENSILVMANSGAKGNILNLAMMSAVVGQQALRGKRIELGYEDRTLSLFGKNDLSPEARGFITNSFKNGLTPVEFFFWAMTGRDSLMDTALRTPKSGYLYRRLSNALQDLKVEYDYTVRDANKIIIQFKYGEDNIDVSKSDGGTIDVRNLIRQVMRKVI